MLKKITINDNTIISSTSFSLMLSDNSCFFYKIVFYALSNSSNLLIFYRNKNSLPNMSSTHRVLTSHHHQITVENAYLYLCTINARISILSNKYQNKIRSRSNQIWTFTLHTYTKLPISNAESTAPIR